MIHTKALSSPITLGDLKQGYLQQTTAPLDGMWLFGFVPMASHYGFYSDEQLIGYCAINEEGYLLQFFLSAPFQSQADTVFKSLFADKSCTGKVVGAFVSTAEPEYLSHCADSFTGFKVNSLMYQLDSHFCPRPELSENDSVSMVLVTREQLADAVEVAVNSIGAPREWLRGYYEKLIGREELFGFWKEKELVAMGESRGNDEYQKEHVDLGVIVATTHQGQGLATHILRTLATLTQAKGLMPICSTEKTNLAAQKAITRAGFVARHRILQFTS